MMSYRSAVGYATATYRNSIPPFLRYCAKHYPEAACISRDMLDRWLSFYEYSINGQAAFISLIREYTKYRNFQGYPDFIPDDDYTIKRTPYNPYLFTDDELSGLFFTIDSYTGSTSGKRFMPEMILPVYSRLLYFFKNGTAGPTKGPGTIRYGAGSLQKQKSSGVELLVLMTCATLSHQGTLSAG